MSVDLKTEYLGLSLKNPIGASCSPLTGKMDRLKQLEDAGVSVVVLPSLFEEQIEQEEAELANLRDYGAEGFAEALTFFPELNDYNVGTDNYLEIVRTAKRDLSIPVIASLNGVSKGGWLRYAKLYEEAGADAIELNIYYLATDPNVDGATIERRYIDLVKGVTDAVSIPVSVKIGPFFSSVAYMAKQFEKAGAQGLVMFNRFMQPDIDLDSLAVNPALELSTPSELRLPLRWIAILRNQLTLSMAANSGIYSAQDMCKALLVGADVAMMTSSLLKHGPAHAQVLLQKFSEWMEQNDYGSVTQLKGSMTKESVEQPDQFERANYMKAIINYTSE